MAVVGADIYLNGVKIKRPDEFSISSYALTKSGRTASGKLTADIIAKKRKFFFTYRIIHGSDMDTIMEQIDGSNFFLTIRYTENDVVKTATVYAGEIPRNRRTSGGVGGWFWTDFNFNLIEQ